MGVELGLGVSGVECTYTYNHVLGCDGIFSEVRVLMRRQKSEKVQNKGVSW